MDSPKNIKDAVSELKKARQEKTDKVKQAVKDSKAGRHKQTAQ